MELTQARLRASLSYDEVSGDFAWLSCRSRGGASAGSLARNGYRRISIGGRRYLAHRLAWLYVHGEWPKGQIDHLNGRRSDNALRNLRDVDASTNQQNRHRAQGSNPFPWVTWKRAEHRWRACFQANGVAIHVGHFTSAEAAHEAALAKRRAMGIGAPLPPAAEPTQEAPHAA